MDANLILLVSTFLLFFLAIAVLFLAVSYLNLLKQLRQLQTAQEDTLDLAKHRADTIIEHAHEKSLDILETSEGKAKEILKKTNLFTSSSQADVEKELQTVAEKEIATYREVLESVRQDLSRLFEEILKEVQSSAQSELKKFQTQATATLQSSAENLLSDVKAESKQTQSDIAAYKQKMMTEIEKNAFEMSQRLLQEVAGKTLTRSEHEALVIQALEKAKNAELF